MNTGRNTERKGKSKEIKNTGNEMESNLATFTLPDSLPCSEVDFPFVPKRKITANWNEIVEESDRKLRELRKYEDSKKSPVPISPFINTECSYLQKQVFILLAPALEDTLRKACIWKALKTQKCFFNGIDHVAQELWNKNPQHPERKDNNVHIFDMPWIRKLLKIYPRSYYPKSWLWTEEYAATVIQKTFRQYLVQREAEVQEMRNFWKKIQMESTMPEIQLNPLLSKKFASSNNI